MQADRFDKRQMLKYVGDFSQLFGIKEHTLTDGKAKGMKAFEVRNGSGLAFTVLADRGLDIAGLSFKGRRHTMKMRASNFCGAFLPVS